MPVHFRTHAFDRPISWPECTFKFSDRSLSEDLFGDDELESFLSELTRLTEGRIDVRSIWDYISSRTGNCSLQFTKFYEPINSEQFLVDQTKQNDNEMEQVRVNRTIRCTVLSKVRTPDRLKVDHRIKLTQERL